MLNILKPEASKIPGLEDFDWGTLRKYSRDGKLAAHKVLPGPGFGLPDFLVPNDVREAITDAGCDVAFRHL